MRNAGLLTAAGFETTGYTLTTASYHLLANPDMKVRLKKELLDAWPDVNVIPAWSDLEKLPYLAAVLKESLRMSNGVMSRLPRINKVTKMQFGEWEIPRGTPISMSQPLVHQHPSVFPDPHRFDPDRWLQGEESKRLERYLVSFSRGQRACIGIYLAQAELHLALATVFRRFDLELTETQQDAVDVYHDNFIPVAKKGTGGVKAFVL